MDSLTADQMRTGMAECLLELQGRLQANSTPGADERLANLITSYIEEEFATHSKKIEDKIQEAVNTCVAEKLGGTVFSDCVKAGLAEAAPYITKSAAEAAVKSVPLSLVIDNCDAADVSHLSLGQAIVSLAKENRQLKKNMLEVRALVIGVERILKDSSKDILDAAIDIMKDM